MRRSVVPMLGETDPLVVGRRIRENMEVPTSTLRPPPLGVPSGWAPGNALVHASGEWIEDASTFVVETEGVEHRLVFASSFAMRVLARGARVGSRLRDVLPFAEAQPLLACVDDVLASGSGMRAHDLPLAVATSAGSRMQHVRCTFAPRVDAAGAVVGVSCLGLDVTDHVRARLEEQSVRERAERAVTMLSRFQTVTTSLAAAMDEEDVADVILGEATIALLADTATLHIERNGVLELVRQRGVVGEVLDRIRRVSLDSPLPAAEAFRSGEPFWVETYGAFLQVAPEVVGTPSSGARARAFCCLPLWLGATPIGAMAFGFFHERRFDETERALIEGLAHQCAQSVERARLHEQQRLAANRLRMLAEADVLLASSLDYQTTLANVSRVLVPQYADWCMVDVLEEGEDVPRTASFAHRDLAKTGLGYELRRRYPPRADDRRGFMAVFRSGEPTLFPHVTDEFLAFQCVDPAHLELVRELGMRSAIAVPLKSRERTLGVLTAVWANDARRYDKADLRFVEDLAARAVLALVNARLHGEAQAAIRTRDEFLSIASHELNTPLTSLRLVIETLRRGKVPPEQVDGKIKVAERQVNRIANLVSDLLDVSHIVAGRVPNRPERTDLATVAREVVARLDEHAAAAQVITLRADAPVVGHWDPSRLDQVVSNLVTNAVKYGEGKPVEVTVERTATFARLVVRDHGMGIARENQARIFERFERAVSSRNFGGFGLGLWIARKAIEAAGGTVQVESNPGQGSTFTVELPLAVPDRDRGALPPASRP